MSYLLDTDICIYILNNKSPELQKRFQEKGGARICVSTLTEAELYYGAIHSAHPEKNRERVKDLLGPLEIIPFDSDAAREFASIKQTLTTKGKPIGAIDMLVAAIARAKSLTIVTNNLKHFESIPNLSVENWL